MSNLSENPEALALEPVEPRCAGGAKVEIVTSRNVPLGGLRAMTVHRTLPQRQRSFVGAWCFVDHYGPDDVAATGGMDVAPHPHTGLQTVSWLFEGEITHHDSAGNHAVVRPGEVNLMTAGNGICHSEVSTQDTTVLQGVQLWAALPDSDRFHAPMFENYPVPRVAFDGGTVSVFIGSLLGVTSPIKTFTPLVGAEINLEVGASLTYEVNPSFEHGLVLDRGAVALEGIEVGRTNLAYTGIGETRLTVVNTGSEPARFLVLGGEPFEEHIVMWWNFIGRTPEEIEKFRADWEAGVPTDAFGDGPDAAYMTEREADLAGAASRFGRVHGYVSHDPRGFSRIPAPVMPIVKLKPRINPAPVARPEMRIEQ
ncbi:MAG: pirin family protein [Mobiluncus porci]|uniref:Pirin family protein n=1 Tax=Mobiluncus porci TaxID=2652278 RepID=A0A7K0K1R5_9ACTO|nr:MULTISPECIES: pirin family protein [Mobiluncus]MCI6584267.1 pirin family protein [Mobiluncus sp.]MDD7540732.1 pirin family protein [Mobiluncus porci]MDY5748294.1 pirin family protein [Mobiluncus porci]MST49359.1 pirin family protein [Mobiluncus porci]